MIKTRWGIVDNIGVYLTFTLATIGCSSAHPPPAQFAAPVATETRAAVRPPAQPYRVSSSPPPTVTQVRIDENILRICGIRMDKAFFSFDSSQLTADDLGPLVDVAECFAHGPLKDRPMKLIGRADPRGETEYNMVLGQSRADQVSSFLERRGVDRHRIMTTSRGAMDARGTEEIGWATDRRVDVMLGS